MRAFPALLVSLLLALAGPARAACDAPADTTAITSAISDAEATFADLDIAAFKEATDRIRAVIPCLQDPVTRRVAAEVHRFLGIRAFGDRDPAAPTYFAAARSIEPDYVFPPELIPEGNPLHQVYRSIDLTTGRSVPVSEPAGGYLQFDGRSGAERPAAWPTLFQRFDSSGAVVDTRYLHPGDPLPDYPVKRVRIVVVDPGPEPVEPIVPVRPPPSPARTPLLVGALSAAAATGVMYGMAGVAKGTFNDPSTPDADLDALRRRANTLSVASAVTGTVGLGLGVGVALTW